VTANDGEECPSAVDGDEMFWQGLNSSGVPVQSSDAERQHKIRVPGQTMISNASCFHHGLRSAKPDGVGDETRGGRSAGIHFDGVIG